MLSKVLKVVGGLIGVVALGAGAFYGWAVMTTNGKFAETYDAHTVEFTVPFPLSEVELAELRTQKAADLVAAAAAAAGDGGVQLASVSTGDLAADPLAGLDLDAIALERAIARGKHLVDARYGCTICHGGDFSGGTMVDSPVVGTFKGPNLTGGKGSNVGSFSTADWDRLVRHGVRSDGTPVVMPSKDYVAMSDQELSDVIAYIRSQPAVDNEVPKPVVGPLFNVLIATGNIRFSAQDYAGNTTHIVVPPATAPTAEFGKHLSFTCTGCHGDNLAGGPIEGGDPSWAPASNLTPEGLKGWTYEQFDKTVRSGVRADGTPLKMPMTEVIPMLSNTTQEETQALWAYLQTLPATASKL